MCMYEKKTCKMPIVMTIAAFKPISHKTRLDTRFLYGILGYTRVYWYEYWAPTIPWYELDSNVARVCTNKARSARFVTV